MGKSSTHCSLHRLVSLLLVFSALFSPASCADTMDRASSLRDGETLVSAGGRFELGFFSPGRSTKRYLCIRFRKGQEKPIVWVANRQRPVLGGSTGVLKFGGDGNLVVVVNKDGDVVWSTAARSDGAGTNRIAQLLDSGNLVLRDADGVDVRAGGILWQSFDEPGNTLLPGMKLLVNRKTGASRRISSWTSDDDPSPGNYSFGLEVNKLPRLVLRDGSSTIRFTTGLWNGVRFTGFPFMNANTIFNSTIVSSGDETYYTDVMINNTSLQRGLLHPNGEFERFVWTDETGAWSWLWMVPTTCERYSFCGPFGVCGVDVPFPFCSCLRGFRQKEPREWFAGKVAGGCVRETPSPCGSVGDVFLPVMQMKLPELDNSSTVSMGIMSLGECRAKCARDCSCTAYAVADVRDGGKGCITWSGGLVDIRSFSINVDQQFYLRVSASDLDRPSDSNKKKNNIVAIVASVTVVSLVVILIVLCGCWVNKRKSKKVNADKIRIQRILYHHHCNYKRKPWNDDSADREDSDLPLFDIETITSATNNFSLGNKVGEGGFGTVYKAWKLWQEDNCLRLLDPVVKSTCPEAEVMRCMQVGLLCVQEHACDRPTMVTVVMMLGSETVALPRPKKPGFLVFKSLNSNVASSSSWKQEYSTNEMTISSILGR